MQLDQRHKTGEKVTSTMLDVIVSACARMGDANRAFETFEAYPKLGLSHRTESYNALMEVCAQQRQVEVIMKLLQEMSKGGIKPNANTYMQVRSMLVPVIKTMSAMCLPDHRRVHQQWRHFWNLACVDDHAERRIHANSESAGTRI